MKLEKFRIVEMASGKYIKTNLTLREAVHAVTRKEHLYQMEVQSPHNDRKKGK